MRRSCAGSMAQTTELGGAEHGGAKCPLRLGAAKQDLSVVSWVWGVWFRRDLLLLEGPAIARSRSSTPAGFGGAGSCGMMLHGVVWLTLRVLPPAHTRSDLTRVSPPTL